MNALKNRTVVVACGVGRDSVGMLAGLHDRRIRPAAILFADVKSGDTIPILDSRGIVW